MKQPQDWFDVLESNEDENLIVWYDDADDVSDTIRLKLERKKRRKEEEEGDGRW